MAQKVLQKIFRRTTPKSASWQEVELKGHIPVLDGIRGIAIWLVIFYHCTRIKPTAPIDDTYFLFGRSLWIGVDLFFILSGFLITGILLDSRNGKRYFRSFYARRTLRIFPLYYAVVAFCIFAAPHLPFFEGMRPLPAQHQWWYWLYGSNFLAAEIGLGHVMLAPTWSLAIEEQFYLVWPLLVFLLPRRALITLCVFLIIMSCGLRWYLLANGTSRLAIYVLTFTRMDPLAAGALVAILARGKGGLKGLQPWAWGIAGVFGIAFCYLFYNGMINQRQTPMIQYGYSVVALLFASLITISLSIQPSSKIGLFLTSKVLTIPGKYCYALYLFNRPVLGFVSVYLFDYVAFPRLYGSSIPGQLVFFPIVFALSLLLAVLSWHLFEKHFLKLKKFFPTDKIV